VSIPGRNDDMPAHLFSQSVQPELGYVLTSSVCRITLIMITPLPAADKAQKPAPITKKPETEWGVRTMCEPYRLREPFHLLLHARERNYDRREK